MELEVFKRFDHTPFSVGVEQVKNAPGTWNSSKVSIYRDGRLIGEYLRNYHNYGKNTFYPFLANGEWYALYSASYTSTRVMKLYEDHIEDWCGESAHPNGFCPVEFYVPQYVHSQPSMNIQGKDDKYDVFYVDCDTEADEFSGEIESDDFVSLNHCDFGFLCGCVWGDDTSWKLRYVDLSKVSDKILEITDKFGYWELPDDLTLKECIRMDGWEPNHNWIKLTGTKTVNVKTGEQE